MGRHVVGRRAVWRLLLALLFVAQGTCSIQGTRIKQGRRVLPRMLLVGGGRPRDTRRYPYLTRIHFLLNDMIANCGGTLVSPRVVLTAAHCTALAQRGGTNVYLRIGAFNPWLDEALGRTYELRRAVKVVSHPGYVQQPANRPTSPNDVALVLLDEPVPPYYPTITLANASMPYPRDATELLAVGWGSTDSHSSQPAFDLQEVALPAVSRRQCGQQWTYASASPTLIKSGHICAGLQSQRNICFGDSGGPLLLRGRHAVSDVQLGITSFSFPTCALPGTPSVFTFIPAYRRWIDEQVAQLDPPKRAAAKTAIPRVPVYAAAAAAADAAHDAQREQQQEAAQERKQQEREQQRKERQQDEERQQQHEERQKQHEERAPAAAEDAAAPAVAARAGAAAAAAAEEAEAETAPLNPQSSTS